MLDSELRAEMEYDMRQEAYEDERYEVNMRNDYEFFLYQMDSELGELQDLVRDIKHRHELYGWEFDIKEII